jgi:hypothetical protein
MAPLLRVFDTVLVVPERSFVILRYDGKVPAMAFVLNASRSSLVHPLSARPRRSICATSSPYTNAEKSPKGIIDRGDAHDPA